MRVMARDDNGRPVEVILKLRNPGTPSGDGHFLGTSLACELIFAMLARHLGLSVPDFAIAEVGPIFASSLPDRDAANRLSASLGPNFASVAVRPAPPDWDPACASHSLELRQSIDDVLAFDFSIVNADRRASNPNLLWDGRDHVQLIDHGLAGMAFLWSPEDDESVQLLTERHVQEHSGYPFLYNKGQPFARVPNQWAALCTDEFWADMLSLIPSAWERAPGDISRIISFLRARVNSIPALQIELQRIVR